MCREQNNLSPNDELLALLGLIQQSSNLNLLNYLNNCQEGYKKTKSKKILFTALSFGFLLIAGFLYLLETSNILVGFHIPYIEAEIPHILLMFMLILFAIGVLKVESE